MTTPRSAQTMVIGPKRRSDAGSGNATKSSPAGVTIRPASQEEVTARRESVARDALETFGVALGLFGTATGSTAVTLDSITVGVHAETVAPSLAEYAEGHSFAAAILDRAKIFTEIAGMSLAIMPLILQIMANHAPKNPDGTPQEIPEQMRAMGVMPPDKLLERYRAQMELKQARMEARLAQEIAEARQQAAQYAAQAANPTGDVPA